MEETDVKGESRTAVSDWIDRIDTDDGTKWQPLLDDIKKYIGVNFSEDLEEGCFYICSNIIRFNSMSFHIFDKLEKKSFFIGILFGETFYLDALWGTVGKTAWADDSNNIASCE